MARVVVVEHADQVLQLLRRGFNSAEKWIAVGPSARACLEELGFSHQLTSDFCDSRDVEENCETGHRLLREVCNYLDDRILDQDADLRDWGMRPFLFHIFPLTIVHDGLRIRTLQFSKIIEAFSSDTIVVQREHHLPWGLLGLGFANRETLWGHIAALPGWPPRLEIIDNLAATQTRTDTRARDAAVHLVRNSIPLMTAGRCHRARDYRGLLDLVKRSRTGSALVIGEGNEWRYVWPQLRREYGARILFASDASFTRGLASSEAAEPDSIDAALAASSRGSDAFRAEGVSFYPLLKQRLAWIMTTSPYWFRATARRALAVCRAYDVRAILRQSSSSATAHVVDRAARLLNIPVCVWQHGFVGYQRTITQCFDYTDLMTADKTFVYGHEAEKAFTAYAQRFEGEVLAVGSASLDNIRACSMRAADAQRRHDRALASRARSQRILYASTNYFQNDLYFGVSPLPNDCLLYSDQSLIVRRLIEFLDSIDLEIILKLHPYRGSLDPPWSKRVPQSSRLRVVKDEHTFVELLEWADGVVLDYPSSTLLQAAAAGRPIFVLMRHWRYPVEARALLERRVACFDTADELMAGMKRWVVAREYPADAEDTAFLKAYGIHAGDGGAAKRVVAALGKASTLGRLER